MPRNCRQRALFATLNIIGGNMPERIQCKRTKGWRMPENTVYVGRPTRWGNPFYTGMVLTEREVYCSFFNSNVALQFIGIRLSAADAVFLYRDHVTNDRLGTPIIELFKDELCGKNLACWCRLDQPCHADVLLELANENDTPQA